MEIKNLKKAAERIKKAVKNKERIILYGDADLDGSASVIILQESVKNLGGQVAAAYFPDREIEGYGISKDGLDYLKNFSPALLIALDCGIGNVKEVLLAKKMGFSVMIIDHHEVLDEVPKAEIIVDPKQKGDKSFKGFANAGLVFKLSELLLGKLMIESLRKNFLELTALATVADMMPRVGENEIFISEGLRYLEDSWRPGISAFFEISTFENCPTLGQKVQKIISVLNSRDVEDKVPASFRVLTNHSIEDSKELIGKLLEKNGQRREKIKKISAQIEKRISGKESIIFEGADSWDYDLISAVASILCQKYKKPTFIYKILEKESQGTVRPPVGIDSVALMKKCKKFLITYGGHPMAAGFRVKNENLEKFKECLIKNLKGMKPR
ncbi:MAG: DHH family phosphoesterase [Patescibacteria group bacterium]